MTSTIHILVKGVVSFWGDWPHGGKLGESVGIS